MDEIVVKLNDLSAAKRKLEALALTQQARLDALITDEVRQRMGEIKAEYTNQITAASGTVAALEDAVKAAVLANGESVKGADLHAIFAKGRITWDSGKLEGYAAVHPEIIPFRKVGEPTVSIRASK